MKFKSNSKELFKNTRVVSHEIVSREEVVKEFGEEWVKEVERNELLGIKTHLVVEHKGIGQISNWVDKFMKLIK